MLRALLHCTVLVLLVVLATMVSGGALAQNADGYLSGIPDLPLMPGLRELPDGGLVFDKPGGRIVETFAEGAMTSVAVRGFYDETLPQLGWRREGRGTYLREGERLNLELEQNAGSVTVHFRLIPD